MFWKCGGLGEALGMFGYDSFRNHSDARTSGLECARVRVDRRRLRVER
jgi:hypothetical protein